MDKTFTASEVRELAATMGAMNLPTTRDMLNAYADLLEAQEKAVPAAWRANWPGWRQYHDEMNPLPESWDDDAPEVLPLYIHPAASDAGRLAEALLFYADGNHLMLGDPGAWDTVSGEPQNWLCDEAGTATIEDGAIAKQALAAHSAQAQPPAASVPIACSCYDDVARRLCANRGKCSRAEAQAAQENPNG